jgi:hypothetical protein
MEFHVSECATGWFGRDCLQNCQGHCKVGTTCDPKNGRCLGGCAPGWMNDMCTARMYWTLIVSTYLNHS